MNVLHHKLGLLLVGLFVAGCTIEPREFPEPAARTGPVVEVTERGKQRTLVGECLSVGQKAPDAVLINRRGDQVRLSNLRGKVLLLSAVPQLGTAVCDRTARLLEDSDLNDVADVAMFTVSTQTWGEQARWARQNTIRRHMTLSDARDREFGRAYGLLIKQNNKLARCVLVIDKAGIIRWIETQRDMDRLPDIPAAEKLVRELAAQPGAGK